MQPLYQQSQPVEIYLFTEEEKKFLFTNILCNPQEVGASKISVSLVKCWIKYFKLINRAENQKLVYNKKVLRVKDFENLLGMDALWQIAIKSQNEKAKEASQELLVDLHLKLDKNVVD